MYGYYIYTPEVLTWARVIEGDTLRSTGNSNRPKLPNEGSLIMLLSVSSVINNYAH